MANLTFSASPKGGLMAQSKFGVQTSTPTGNVQVPSSNSLDAAYGGTVNKPIGSPSISGVMGAQAKNPNTNLVGTGKNTLPSSQVSKTTSISTPTPSFTPTQANSTAANTYGGAIIDTSGNSGIAKFDPKTGQPLNQTSTPAPSQNQGLFGIAAQNLSNAATGGTAGNVNTATTGLFSQAFGQNPANQNIGRLTDISNNQTPAVTQAQGDYNSFAQSSPYMLAAQYNPNVAADVASGRSAILGQTFSQELAAKQAAVNNALQGQGQQITAANEAGSQALTGQGQQITAGTNAGNLGVNQQQIQNQASQTLLGTPGGSLSTYGLMGGTNLNPQNQASTLAQKVTSGQMSYQDAVSSLGYAGNVGQTLLNQAISQINPNFNVNQSIGQSSAQQTNAQAGGTAVTTANATGLTSAIQAEETLNTQATSAQSMGTNLATALKNSGLNLSNSTDLNTIANNLAGRLGSTGFSQLTTAINDARNAYAQILGTNGTPTGGETQALQDLNMNNSVGQILSSLDQLNAGVKARQDAAHKQTQDYATRLNSAGSSSTQSSSSSSGESSLYSF